MRVPCKAVSAVYTALTSQTAYAISTGLTSLARASTIRAAVGLASLQQVNDRRPSITGFVYVPTPLPVPHEEESWSRVATEIVSNFRVYHLNANSDVQHRCQVLYDLTEFLIEYIVGRDKPETFEVVVVTQTLAFWLSADRGISLFKASAMIWDSLEREGVFPRRPDEYEDEERIVQRTVLDLSGTAHCIQFLTWLRRTLGVESGINVPEGAGGVGLGLLLMPTFKTLVTSFAFPGLEMGLHVGVTTADDTSWTVKFVVQANGPTSIILPGQQERLVKILLELNTRCQLDLSVRGTIELPDTLDRFLKAVLTRRTQAALSQFFSGNIANLRFETECGCSAILLRKEIRQAAGTPPINMPNRKRLRMAVGGPSRTAIAIEDKQNEELVVKKSVAEMLPYCVKANLITVAGSESKGLIIGSTRHIPNLPGLSLAELFGLTNFEAKGKLKQVGPNPLLEWIRELEFYVISDFLVEDYAQFLEYKKAEPVEITHECVLGKVRVLLELKENTQFSAKCRTLQWLLDFWWLQHTCHVVPPATPVHHCLTNLPHKHPYHSELHMPSPTANFRQSPKTLYAMCMPTVMASELPHSGGTSALQLAPCLYPSPTSLSRVMRNATYNIFVNITYALTVLRNCRSRAHLVMVLPKGFPVNDPCDREILHSNLKDHDEMALAKIIADEYAQLKSGLLKMKHAENICVEMVSYLWLEDSYCEGAPVSTRDYLAEQSADTLKWTLVNLNIPNSEQSGDSDDSDSSE